MIKKIFLLSLVLLLPCFAQAKDELLFKGIASVTLQTSHQTLKFDQAVLITHVSIPGRKSILDVRMEALDDFGNTHMKLHFLGDHTYVSAKNQSGFLSDKKIKRMIGLPLSQAEITALMRHQLPASKGWAEIKDDQGRIVMMLRKKGFIQVFFDDFKTKKSFPYSMRIESKKTKLEFIWRQVEL